MIKATDVRIGNLILWNPALFHPTTTLPSIPIEVTSVLEDKIGYVSPNIEHRVEPFEDDVIQTQTEHKPFEEFEPIFLTPYILEKSGFEEHKSLLGDKHWLKENKMKIELKDDELWFTEATSKVRVQSVHQLQNLYFALTEEELEIIL